MQIHAMEYSKNDLSLPCSGLKVMTKCKTKILNPILSKQEKSLNFMTNFLQS